MGAQAGVQFMGNDGWTAEGWQRERHSPLSTSEHVRQTLLIV